MELKRNSNIEIVRIVAIYFVIIHHILSQGFSFASIPAATGNLAFLQAFNSIGNYGNKLFIMISGYFLYETKFSIKKILMIWFELFLYSAAISCIIYIFNLGIYGVTGNGFCFTRLVEKRSFRFSELLFSFLPFITGQNWFATVYIVFLFMVPFLNVMVKNIDKRMHLLLLVLCAFLFHIFQLISIADVYVLNNYTAFFTMFFAGSFFRKYPEVLVPKYKNVSLIAGILLPAVCFAVRFAVIYHFGGMEKVPSMYFNLFLSAFVYDTVFTVSSILILYSLLLFPVRQNWSVNLVASTTFGVYLLHNHNYFRRNLWFDIFKFNEHFEDKYFVVYLLFGAAVLFAACTLIDLFRKFCLEPYYSRLSILIESKLLSKFNH